MGTNRKNKGTGRLHHMDFGAETGTDGTRFRLWAPDARKVVLCLEDGGRGRRLPMVQLEDGWYQYLDDMAMPGSRYRFQIDDGMLVPDPASRFQPEGVHGPSQVVDPLAWRWADAEWCGRHIEEAVFYELHVGAFSPSGTFGGVEARLDYLLDLGVTALELMPVAAFAGRRNWGYDGVLPFSPAARYGGPDGLKALVEAAHRRRMMVFLDVVYNHFGPEGNYLHLYAPSFFTERFHTPWGPAIDFTGPRGREVRRFFVDNALYWLEEFHLDGLRLDAVHTIFDQSASPFLEELAATVRAGPGNARQVHLVLENDGNEMRLLERDAQGLPRHYCAQWNDDVHHALHVLLTGEADGYYGDYASQPVHHLGRALAEGFAYQGEASAWRGGKRRGSPSGALPPAAFVNFLQNHDQIGNRAFGERLGELAAPEALQAATAVLLLSPQLPLLFMGQEWGARQPFFYFCDFAPELAKRVRDGRLQEFGHFAPFADGLVLGTIPDPCAETTFKQCMLDWRALAGEEEQQWLDLHRRLLDLRHRAIVPRLGRTPAVGRYFLPADRVLQVEWHLNGADLALAANFAERPSHLPLPPGEPLYLSDGVRVVGELELPSWSVAFFLDEAKDAGP